MGEYTKFIVALAAAVGVMVVQLGFMTEIEWQQIVTSLAALAGAFGVRQLPNKLKPLSK